MVIQTTPSLAAKITKPARGKARKAVSEKSQQHSENWPPAQKSITVGPDRSSIAMTACRTSGRMNRIHRHGLLWKRFHARHGGGDHGSRLGYGNKKPVARSVCS